MPPLNKFKRFDVRGLMREGIEPFPEILKRVQELGADDGLIVVAPFLPSPLVERLGGEGFASNAQREVAVAEGCAFFDTYEAMGGDGSMGRWVRSSPALGSGDLSHLTHHGHKVVGGMLYRALVAGYVDYRKRLVGTPVTLPVTAAAAPTPADVPVAAPATDKAPVVTPAAAPANGPAAAVVAEGAASPAPADQ